MVRGGSVRVKVKAIDFLVTILSSWTGKHRTPLLSTITPQFLLNHIEDEDYSIILRMLD